MVRECREPGAMLELRSGRYRTIVDPKRGGSLAAFDWTDKPVLRASRPGSMLDTACFPLVPFSNRIARGEFKFGGKAYRLAPNSPQVDPRNPLHGYGWLHEWQVIEVGGSSAIIEHVHAEGEWPWPYRARQSISLGEEGLDLRLEVMNTGKESMPAGLGFHPYFPRRADTLYHGLHRGEWQVDGECLPVSLTEAAEPRDWWDGQPVDARNVDTVYTGRTGPLSIVWPDIANEVRISPSENLAFTVVYTPTGRDFFCIQPVSHETDAVNQPGGCISSLPPGGTMQVSTHMEVGQQGFSAQQAN